jgi:hypothetical protein
MDDYTKGWVQAPNGDSGWLGNELLHPSRENPSRAVWQVMISGVSPRWKATALRPNGTWAWVLGTEEYGTFSSKEVAMQATFVALNS